MVDCTIHLHFHLSQEISPHSTKTNRIDVICFIKMINSYINIRLLYINISSAVNIGHNSNRLQKGSCHSKQSLIREIKFNWQKRVQLARQRGQLARQRVEPARQSSTGKREFKWRDREVNWRDRVEPARQSSTGKREFNWRDREVNRRVQKDQIEQLAMKWNGGTNIKKATSNGYCTHWNRPIHL